MKYNCVIEMYVDFFNSHPMGKRLQKGGRFEGENINFLKFQKFEFPELDFLNYYIGIKTTYGMCLSV